jgi:hypothetical protein
MPRYIGAPWTLYGLQGNQGNGGAGNHGKCGCAPAAAPPESAGFTTQSEATTKPDKCCACPCKPGQDFYSLHTSSVVQNSLPQGGFIGTLSSAAARTVGAVPPGVISSMAAAMGAQPGALSTDM